MNEKNIVANICLTFPMTMLVHVQVLKQKSLHACITSKYEISSVLLSYHAFYAVIYPAYLSERLESNSQRVK